jgi:hypothetical protein
MNKIGKQCKVKWFACSFPIVYYHTNNDFSGMNRIPHPIQRQSWFKVD